MANLDIASTINDALKKRSMNEKHVRELMQEWHKTGTSADTEERAFDLDGFFRHSTNPAKTLKLLLDEDIHHASYMPYYLSAAIEHYHPPLLAEVLEQLPRHGLNVNDVTVKRLQNDNQKVFTNPVGYAAYTTQPDCIRQLAACGAKLDWEYEYTAPGPKMLFGGPPAKIIDPMPPLLMLQYSASPDLGKVMESFETLIDLGARVHNHKSHCHMLNSGRGIFLRERLLAHGLDLNAISEKGHSPFFVSLFFDKASKGAVLDVHLLSKNMWDYIDLGVSLRRSDMYSTLVYANNSDNDTVPAHIRAVPVRPITVESFNSGEKSTMPATG